MIRPRGEEEEEMGRNPNDRDEVIIKSELHIMDCSVYKDRPIQELIDGLLDVKAPISTGDMYIGMHLYSSRFSFLPLLERYRCIMIKANEYFGEEHFSNDPRLFLRYTDPISLTTNTLRIGLCVKGEGNAQLAVNWLAQHDIRCISILPFHSAVVTDEESLME